jgi:phosphomannomutase / phosphoglucomutase
VSAAQEALESPWKPCDLRGNYPLVVSPALFRAIGGAVGSALPPVARVLVAGDFRLSTPELKQALAEGLLQTGARVLDAGQCPTPVAYFAARQANAHAVLVVTASHNPPADNGLKLMLGSQPPTPTQLKEIRAAVDARTFRKGAGRAETIDPRPAYAQAILDRWRSLRAGGVRNVVLDAGNGAWSEMAPEIFRRLGLDSSSISCVADGRFPDRSPDCARAANLWRLRENVRGQSAAIGIAWDGDGDRVAFVDEDGDYVPPDEIAILFARAALSDKEPGPNRNVVIDLKCSEAVRRAVLELRGDPLLERTGHAFMRGRMTAEDALLGLDACGHFFFRELCGGDDGLFAALFLLDLMRASRRELRELRRTLPPIFSTPEIRIPLSAVSYASASDALSTALPNAAVTCYDGLRFVMEDGVVLLRESGTEPVLSLRIEGFSAGVYARLLAQCAQALPQAERLFDLGLRQNGASNPQPFLT